RFVGRYPVGTVTYRAPDLEVTSSTFSPFIPLDVAASTLPATTVTFTLRNTSRSAVRAEVVGSSANPVCLTSRNEQPTRLEANPFRGRRLKGVEFTATETTSDSTDIVFEDAPEQGQRLDSGVSFGAIVQGCHPFGDIWVVIVSTTCYTCVAR
ncbi:GH116 family glycosyl-hydrolase, partial [Kibdelosporangium lantanae]